ncbi:MAG: hypothetical protein KC496_06525 [Anaerolineae bacterium]|nr:hypothetical protein [Anaerolineae bacterium]
MHPIVYYISSHGFGHAARQQAVIQQLARRGVAVHVRTAAPQQFFQEAASYHAQRYDVGMLQADALSYDVAGSLRWLETFMQEQDALIAQEVAFVREIGAGLIVSDMPPLAMEVASAADVPCLAITHFTWDWVYGHYVDQYPQAVPLIEAIRASYAKTTLALQLQMPIPHAFDMFPRVEAIPGLYNPVTKSRADIQAEFNLAPDMRVGLISMGGHAWSNLDLRALKAMHDWVFLVNDAAWESVSDAPQRFRRVPPGYAAYQNLIAHSDVLVGKVGGSTVAEVVGHGTPMIYTTHPLWRESSLLRETLERSAVASQYLPLENFQRGEWVEALNAVYEMPRRQAYSQPNGAAIAAEKVMAMC